MVAKQHLDSHRIFWSLVAVHRWIAPCVFRACFQTERCFPTQAVRRLKEHLYPVDIKNVTPEAVEAAARMYHAKLLEEPLSDAEFFSVPGRENVKLSASSMDFLPLYREESICRLLVLLDPQEKHTVLAIYLHSSWWLVEDAVKTADPSRDGLIEVQTFAERIVLFLLNGIIFGMLEKNLSHDEPFLPHSKRECAKILWRSGDAAAFYTVKAKGSLCDGHSSQCYLLPVLDTVFVRKKFRRRGLGTKMLHDFCQTFAAEEALGLSHPISAGMYQVCRKFLETHPEEQSRLWEVEAPGDWSQRVNIWLKIQLEQNLAKKVNLTCEVGSTQDDEGELKKKVGRIPDTGTSPDAAEIFCDDPELVSGQQPHGGEDVVQHEAEAQQHKELKKKANREEPVEGSVPKRVRTMS
ncbi:protein FAM169B-like isoform X1 [Varanus komodoensis]|uniref:protein FAM169B-like isoform X1 n=2 Tax=Varanus komodoensis TaxID=61221 RepID=UPI001CF799A3|nr:protein FAM169B-like isoform X1 [Varanus komodoensis]